MALRVDSGFRKFIGAPLDENIAAYLRALEDYGTKLGLKSLLWRQSRDSILDPDKGYVSHLQFVDIFFERTLHIGNEGRNNKIAATWMLRREDIEHSFMFALVLSEIPHFQVHFLVSTDRPAGTKMPWLMEEKESLITFGLANVVHMKGDIFGHKPWLYIDSKIMRSKMLRSRFEDSFWSGTALTQEMMGTLVKELDASTSVTLLHAKEIGAFLKQCDERLLSSLGTSHFEHLIARTGLSLSEWTSL